ncbi:hypothetical protein [Celeribacter sp. PS-C1]|uniref:hypothetical protein n=1 Tax=Celeribacter sp. PS-C1 TaxID=2820813 RepID=UPI001CA4F2F3|nr:hypothetical protein [Celeribacter sp. PS-C1]MBW6419753.1 hypothetical protein [Celeribacter sp. PS-C1]
MTSLKPKLVLHVGMPKTGSSALQKWFATSRAHLLTQGVLYPQSNKNKSHPFLSLPLDFEADGQRLLVDEIGRSQIKADQVFEKTWTALEAEIRVTSPETVVLSTEYLFKRIGNKGRERLLRAIDRTFSETKIAIYVRQPSKFYASHVQQRIKHSATLPAIQPVSWRRKIEAWEEAFPGSVSIRTYEKSALIAGDIIADFLTSYLGLTRHDTPGEATVNESMSAEAAQVLQALQLDRFPGQDDVVIPERNRLRKKVLEVDRKLSGFTRPKLLAKIADHIDYASTDLLWLRDEYGILFDHLDYARVTDRPEGHLPADQISDVFEINAERLSALEKVMAEARGVTWLKACAKALGLS